jgi:hypothetical protein
MHSCKQIILPYGQPYPNILNKPLKKACQEFELAGTGGSIEEHPSLYQVDGEVGRFTFKTYDVKAKNNKTLFAGIGFRSEPRNSSVMNAGAWVVVVILVNGLKRLA